MTAGDTLEQAETAALTVVRAIILLQRRSAAFRAMGIDGNVIPLHAVALEALRLVARSHA